MSGEASSPFNSEDTIKCPSSSVSDVERDHADRVTGDQVNPFLLVIESEGENTIEILDEINPFLLV